METVYLILFLIIFPIIKNEKTLHQKKIELKLNEIKTENSKLESLINSFSNSFISLSQELNKNNIIPKEENSIFKKEKKPKFSPLNPKIDNLIIKHNEPFEWNLLPSKNKPPSERKGECSIIIDNYLIIFGGCDLEDNCNNDLYYFDLQNRYWEKIKIKNEIPSPRQFHSCNLYGNKIIIYGGNKGSDLKNDLFSYDIEKKKFKRLQFKNDKKEGRKNHKGIIDNKGRLFIFGGYTIKGYSNDLFIINLTNEEFEYINIRGNIPNPRSNFIFEYSNNYIFLFGGFQEGGSLNDFYKFNTETFLWESIQNSNFPKSKEGFSSILIENEIYIFGGCDYKSNSCSSEIFVFNILNNNFTKIQSKIIQPRFHSSFHFYRGNFIIFGGCEFDNKCFNDIYKMNITILCPNNCNSNGFCNEKIGCICYESFFESDCSKKVICQNNCNNRGKCLLNGKCNCDKFYTGKNCEINLGCVKNCTSEKNGVCNMEKNICICNQGFEGEFCQNKVNDSLFDFNFNENKNKEKENKVLMNEQQILIQEYSKVLNKNSKNLKLLNEISMRYNFIVLIGIFIIVLCCFVFKKIISEKEIKSE